MELIVAKNPGDASLTIIKHFTAIGGKFTGAQAVALCRGSPMVMDLATLGARNVLKVLTHMLDKFGGVQFR
eukprot:13548087-Alexandrium_andersonii.AAC.1